MLSNFVYLVWKEVINMKNLAKILLSARKKLGFSSEYVANVINIQVYDLKAFEHNISELPSEIVNKLCELYGLSLDSLIGNTKSYNSTMYARLDKSEGLSEKDKELLFELQQYQLSER